jgi:hypothetical protein
MIAGTTERTAATILSTTNMASPTFTTMPKLFSTTEQAMKMRKMAIKNTSQPLKIPNNKLTQAGAS